MTNVSPLTSTFRIVNVSQSLLLNCIFRSCISACGCNEQGVEKGDMTCDQDGKCHCGCDIRGDKCNECEFGHHGFPNCTGKLTQTFD